MILLSMYRQTARRITFQVFFELASPVPMFFMGSFSDGDLK